MKHKAFVIAWANGESVQFRMTPNSSIWRDVPRDVPFFWAEDWEYRIRKKYEPGQMLHDSLDPYVKWKHSSHDVKRFYAEAEEKFKQLLKDNNEV